MGSFDDAIREHLELSRRHGADPSEVNRKELEAFGAPLLERTIASATPPEEGGGASCGISVRRVSDAEASADPADPRLSEETMELDMGAVLEGVATDGASTARAQSPSTRAAAA
jgi:hypothetical protein